LVLLTANIPWVPNVVSSGEKDQQEIQIECYLLGPGLVVVIDTVRCPESRRVNTQKTGSVLGDCVAVQASVHILILAAAALAEVVLLGGSLPGDVHLHAIRICKNKITVG